jgi:hypothetical protein
MAKRPKSGIPAPTMTPYQREQIEAMVTAARARLLEADPDIERDQGLFIDMLDGECDGIDFMRQLGRAYVDCKAWIDATEDRIDDLKARKERWEKRANIYKGTFYGLLQVAGLPGLPDTDFTAFSTEGRQKLNDDVDEHVLELPERYVVVERRVNRALLLQDLKDGVEVPFASLDNGRGAFVIKRK